MKESTSYSEIVHKPIDVVWNHLLYKIDYPEKFVPNVSDTVILEKNTEATIRQMTITIPDKVMTIIEKITAAPYIVRFEIMEHPLVNGYVDNHAEAINENSTRLTYTMNWQNKLNHSSANNVDMLKAAVIKSKLYIEENN